MPRTLALTVLIAGALTTAACTSSARPSEPTRMHPAAVRRAPAAVSAHATTASASGQRASTATTASASGQRASAATTARLWVWTEPSAGFGPVYSFIGNATRLLDMTMYELVDTRAERALAAAEARGVKVRVVLNSRYEKTRNLPAYDYLRRHGVGVVWASGRYYFTHEKALVADGRRLLLLTANLTSRYYSDTRDFIVRDTDAADARAAARVFAADYAHEPVTPTRGARLVWSPTTSQSALLSVIRGAHHSLGIENEEMSDSTIVDALASAARRGVTVTVVMTADSEYDAELAKLRRAGVRVRLYPDSSRWIYIHAKTVVADAGRTDERAFVGSQNFSVTSLWDNRELGLLTGSGPVVHTLSAVVAHDAAAAPRH